MATQVLTSAAPTMHDLEAWLGDLASYRMFAQSLANSLGMKEFAYSPADYDKTVSWARREFSRKPKEVHAEINRVISDTDRAARCFFVQAASEIRNNWEDVPVGARALVAAFVVNAECLNTTGNPIGLEKLGEHKRRAMNLGQYKKLFQHD